MKRQRAHVPCYPLSDVTGCHSGCGALRACDPPLVSISTCRLCSASTLIAAMRRTSVLAWTNVYTPRYQRVIAIRTIANVSIETASRWGSSDSISRGIPCHVCRRSDSLRSFLGVSWMYVQIFSSSQVPVSTIFPRGLICGESAGMTGEVIF